MRQLLVGLAIAGIESAGVAGTVEHASAQLAATRPVSWFQPLRDDVSPATPAYKWTGAVGPDINGVYDWPWVFPNPAFTSGGFPSMQFQVAVSHRAAGDTLYLYVLANYSSSMTDPDDEIVIMLDAGHDHAALDPSDRGFRFRRSGTIEAVTGNPLSAGTVCTSFVCSSGNFFIESVPILGDMIVEAKFVPSDFGVQGLAGNVGAFLRAFSVNGGSQSVWQGAGPSNPTSWPHLKLGKPLDLVLVLDVSGSMGSPACSGCPPGPTNPTKYKRLQEAVQLSLSALSALGSPADSLGVRYFDTNIDPTTGADSQLQTVPTATSSITSTLPVRGPGSATAMGGGLQSAINLLGPGLDPLRSKNIILFTDGMQNLNPMVFDVSGASGCPTNTPDLDIRDVTGFASNPDVPATSPETELDTALGITINTIAITDAAGMYPDLLCKIAGETGGTHRQTIDPNSDLGVLFFEQMITSLHDQSPQILAHRAGLLSSEGATETFASDRTSQRLAFALSWPGSERLTMQVSKDGVVIPPLLATDIGGDKHRVFAVDVPLEVNGQVVAAEGTWEVHIDGPLDAAYQVAAVTDELALQYDFSTGGSSHVVGTPLELGATVRVGGAPMDDAIVTATVLRPGEALGNVFADTDPPQQTSEPQSLPLQDRFLSLLEVDGVSERLRPVGRTITLSPSGNGTYAGVFSDTDVPGSYTLAFTIDAEHDEIGVVHRETTVATYVRFGEADSSASKYVARVVGRSPDQMTQIVIDLTFVDRFGSHLGPGWGQVLQITTSQGSVDMDGLQDLLDGTYQVPISVPEGSDPLVRISIFGETAYDGPLSQILHDPRWTLLGGAGVAVPTGTFGNTYDPGLNLVAGFDYRVLPSVSVGASLGYNRFEGKGALDDVSWFNATLGGRYFLNVGTTAPFVGAGIGLYVPDTGSTRAGGNVGVGLQWVPWHVGFEVGADYHDVFGASTQFVHSHVGLVLRF